jgi:Mg-chelatase subunit ChlD
MDLMMASSLPIELTHPLFLLGLAALPVLGWYFWRGLIDFARWQRIASLALRAAIVVLLVLALAGLTWLSPTREQFVVFAIDESNSVGDDARQMAASYLEKAVQAAGPNRVAFLSFAADPGLVHAERGKSSPQLDRGATNIAAAIEVAAAAIPPSYVPHIVLLSDGNQTAGDAVKAALRGRVPVSTVPLAARSEPEVAVGAVSVPAQIREGEPFYVEVSVDANHDDEGSIEVYRGAHKVISEKLSVKKGENKLRIRQTVTGEKAAQYTARISGFQDQFQDNNSASGLVFSTGKPRALLIENDVKLARNLSWALEQEGIHVDVRPARGMPDSLADLQNYEVLIVSNVPATDLTQRQMEIARTFVQDLGGGLIMIGGDQAFGLGGYYKTTIEEILPVRSDFEKEKEKPSLAMAIVIDKSGSMGGQKIELAKDAAKGAVELLGQNDKIAVLAFDGETYVVCEMQPASNKSHVLDKVSSIEAGGGTVMAPAMETAFETLRDTVAKLKHVIILTDGVSAPGPFEDIAQNMAQARITCSTVAVSSGDEVDVKLLQEIARIGNGRYYYTDDPSSVPQIFAKETVAASKSAINEQPFLPQVFRPTQVLSDIDLAQVPFLLGYVTTRPKPTCELILISEKGDPILAWWRYGLGMTVGFTSDAKSRWAAEWVTWPGFSRFWAQVVRHAMRKSETKGSLVQVEQKDRKVVVSLDSVDARGRFLNNADTELTLIDPQLGNRTVPMQQIAPGRYSATVETPRDGAYHMELIQKQSGQPVHQSSRGIVVGYPDELRLKPTNDEALKELARLTGGYHNPSPEAVFAGGERTAARATPLWPYLVMLAAILFLFDVALRRIDLQLLFGRRASSFGFVPARQRD